MLAKRETRSLTPADVVQALAPFDEHPSPDLVEAILRYIDILLFWNQRVNLTRITEPAEILRRHFGESIFAARSVPISGGRLADLGPGAGFPGLALKLAVPCLQVSLVEANAKKAAFLNEVIRELKLQEVVVWRRRIEHIKSEDLQVDVVTARAVGALPSILSCSKTILLSGGRLVLWLGRAECEALTGRAGWAWGQPARIPLSGRTFLLTGSPS